MFEQPHTLLVRWKRNQTCGLTRTYEQSFKSPPRQETSCYPVGMKPLRTLSPGARSENVLGLTARKRARSGSANLNTLRNQGPNHGRIGRDGRNLQKGAHRYLEPFTCAGRRGAMAGSCPPTPDLSDEFDEHDAGFDEVDPSIWTLKPGSRTSLLGNRAHWSCMRLVFSQIPEPR
jgi:hypothetical protein